MKRRLVLLAPLALAVIPRRALAHSFTLGPIEIGHPWAKPTVTEAAALFMALYDTGDKPDRLAGASTPIATQVIFRDTGGDALEYYDLRPKRPLALRPGGRYIALHGLKKPLAIDDAFPLTLIFSTAGRITVSVLVEEGPDENS
ncbi:MAG TPA: copper chaperone PCu(A)C [Stellaceae bacterium]|nr:copper chaperone PCu(A)C [Stellaceae bacterium]